MSMAAQIAAESRRGRLLFPLKPIEQESFQGYIVRAAEWNAFSCPAKLLKALGCRPSKGQAWSRAELIQDSELARRLGVTMADADKMLLWSDPESADYHSRTSPIRRVAPTGLQKRAYHREFWCASQLEFCPETWDLLLSRCPKCESSLEWEVSRIDYCGRCMFDLKLAAVLSVSTEIRPQLRFMANLLSRDRRKREAARSKAPPEFQSFSPFIIFDLAALFGCALNAERSGDLRSKSRLHSQGYEHVLLGEGARILLDYPASFRRLFQDEANSATPAFFGRLRRFGRLARPVSKRLDQLARSWEPIVHGPSRLRRNRQQLGQWTLRETAAHLGVQNSQVRRLIDAELMAASRSRGMRRTSQWIDPAEAHRIGAILADRISLERLSQILALPESGIEQLVGIGLLRPNGCPITKTIYHGRQFYWTEAAELLRRIEQNLCDPANEDLKMVTVEELFHGIGGQGKPWAAFISAMLNGKIPAYFGVSCPGRIQIKSLRISDEFAREIVAGRRPELLHVPRPAGAYFSGYCYSRAEAEAHLNCYPRDLTWLRTHGHVRIDYDHIARSQVESLGRELISSREIMWRWRVSPELREGLATEHGIHRVKGPFWPRAAVESHFSELFKPAGATR